MHLILFMLIILAYKLKLYFQGLQKYVTSLACTLKLTLVNTTKTIHVRMYHILKDLSILYTNLVAYSS